MTEIKHDSFWDVCTNDQIFEMRVGFNVSSPVFWDPSNFRCIKKRVISRVDNVPGFSKSVQFIMEENVEKLGEKTQMKLLIRSRVMTSCQEARVFDHIYFGNVMESKIYYQDVGNYSSFFICDEDFLEEVLENMRNDFIMAQREKMRECKSKIKMFNQLLKTVEI